MNRKDALARLKGLDEETQKSVLCSLIGHSRIITTFFGYVYCARCEKQIGDTLASVFNEEDTVIVGHNCNQCQKNFKKLTWRDKHLAPDPFEEEVVV